MRIPLVGLALLSLTVAVWGADPGRASAGLMAMDTRMRPNCP